MVDVAIEDLTALTTPAATDVFAIVDDPAGTPVTKKITHDDLLFSADDTPSTQAYGDAAAKGSSISGARGDHKHAMPSAGGPSQATQSAIEAETNEDTYIPPDLIKHSPGVAKVWGFIAGDGALSSPSYGISSVTDVSIGYRVINFSTNFSTAVYSGTCIVFENSDLGAYGTFHTPAVGSVKHIVRSMDSGSGHQKGLVRDSATSIAIYGDQ